MYNLIVAYQSLSGGYESLVHWTMITTDRNVYDVPKAAATAHDLG